MCNRTGITIQDNPDLLYPALFFIAVGVLLLIARYLDTHFHIFS